MKWAIVILTLLSQGCAISGLSREEGLYLESSENQAKHKNELGIIYNSGNERSPGNRVLYVNGMRVTSNCHRTKGISFMISPVIPLPPIIPLFISPRPYEENLKIYVSKIIDPKDLSIEVDSIKHLPVSTTGYSHTFKIFCPSLVNKEVVLKFDKLKKEIRLIFKSEVQYSFGYMGA